MVALLEKIGSDRVAPARQDSCREHISDGRRGTDSPFRQRVARVAVLNGYPEAGRRPGIDSPAFSDYAHPEETPRLGEMVMQPLPPNALHHGPVGGLTGELTACDPMKAFRS